MDHLKQKMDGSSSTTSFPQIYLTEDVPSSASSSQPPPLPSPPLSAQTAATAQLASSSSAPSATPPRLPEHLMYKNRLQEFAQRSNLALPMYQTVNEGSPHAPKFRSTVLVDGRSYTSQITFTQRKAAEQDVARLALESLSQRIKDEGCPLVCENTLFSKSILNEYATKLNLQRPTYDTVQLEGLLPLFVSSVLFNGTKYAGVPARNKKEAEQLAAQAAILSILGDSSSGTLYEIIKSKSRIYAAVKPNISQCIDASTVSAIANTGHTSVPLDNKDKEVVGLVAASNVSATANTGLTSVALDNKDKEVEGFVAASTVSPIAKTGHTSVTLDNKDTEVAGLVTANDNETKIELPEHAKMPSSSQECQRPMQEPCPEAAKLPNVSLQPGSQQPVGEGSSSKKRRKNKKKANKKSRLESPLPVVAFPLNEVPPCSVAQ